MEQRNLISSSWLCVWTLLFSQFSSDCQACFSWWAVLGGLIGTLAAPLCSAHHTMTGSEVTGCLSHFTHRWNICEVKGVSIHFISIHIWSLDVYLCRNIYFWLDFFGWMNEWGMLNVFPLLSESFSTGGSENSLTPQWHVRHEVNPQNKDPATPSPWRLWDQTILELFLKSKTRGNFNLSISRCSYSRLTWSILRSTHTTVFAHMCLISGAFMTVLNIPGWCWRRQEATRSNVNNGLNRVFS